MRAHPAGPRHGEFTADGAVAPVASAVSVEAMRELASHVWPRGDEELNELRVARLWLCAASRQVLANGLDLLGVGAPERM